MEVPASSEAWLALVASAVAGGILGDLAFFSSIKEAGASLATTVGYTYSLFATLFAVALFGEEVEAWRILGGILVLCGVWLVYRVKRVSSKRGFAAALATAVLWGLSAALLKIPLEEISAFSTTILRLCVLALCLAPLALKQLGSRPRARDVAYLGAGGLLGVGPGYIAMAYSIYLIGASKCAMITSAAPVFTQILSRAILREEITSNLVLGGVLVCLGIAILSV